MRGIQAAVLGFASMTSAAFGQDKATITPDTFGVHDKPARLRSGHDQGVEAGGKLPEPPPGTRLPDRDG